MAAKLHPGLDRKTYDKLPGIRKSLLWYGNRSMAHLRDAMTKPDKQTDAKDLGSATHTALMEPEKFERDFVVAPVIDRRTKAGREAWAAFLQKAESDGQILIDEEDKAVALEMATSLRRIDMVDDLLSASGGLVESSITWTDPETGVECKCRPDFLLPGVEPSPVILDVKTTRDARRKQFARSVNEYGYDVQVGMYSHAVEILTGKVPVFLFACVENTRPYNARLFYCSDGLVNRGWLRYRELLQQYKACLDTGVWPGYGDGIEELDVPEWADA